MDTSEYMKDAKGRLVPREMVSSLDQARDDLVRGIIHDAANLVQALTVFKIRVLDDVKAFVDLSAEQYDTKIGGKKGNITLSTFDGEYRLLIAVDDHIAFDERLQVAKSLIDECIKEWIHGTRSELRILIDDAFAVDKAGKINTGRVLSLRRLAIEDPKWKKAMDALSDSITVVTSKQYVRVYKRNAKGEYVLIPMDVAA